MSDVSAAPLCRKTLFSGGSFQFTHHQISPKWQSCNLLGKRKRAKMMKLEAQMMNPSSYSSRISTDISLYEIPVALFDDYLENKQRVFKAIFPDKRRSQQLNDEEWRVHMLPIDFLFLTVSPVIDMRLRCKTSGNGYPPEVPLDVSKVLELQIVRWELQGLEEMFMPSHFSLGVKGSLYPYRLGPRTRLKGQLQMSITFDLPPVLELVPDNVRKDVAESVLKRLLENMKDKVNGSLIADYGKFKRERSKSLASA